ncbi:hypothetical protein B566_EDAN002138 [Ephemera danica]|nr:hypothetical protein B566_EDAN002138 [Ephemera danica]
MTIQFELKRNKNAKTTVKIVLDEHNTNDTQNVSSVIYIRDPNGNYTEVERRQGQVLDSKLWVHLTINISSTAGSKVQLQLLRHGMKNPVFNKMLEGTVDLNQSMAMVVDINGYQKRHHYAVRYTRSQNNEFSILLKPGCWRVFHFGPLSAIYSSDNGQNQNKFLPYEPSVHMGFSTSKLTLIGNDSIQHNVSFKVEAWYKSFWAIGDILPCYSTRMRNLSDIPLGKINEVHCTNLLSGVSSKFSKTPFYEVNISTIPEYHEVEVPVIEKSMMENKLWFYITTMLLLFILLIVIVISIKILQYFNICVRNESEPFYRRRGSLLVAMKLESIRKRGNNAVSTQRYAPTPGLAEDRNPEDPDYEMIKMPKDTLPAHVPRVPNDLAPPVPPVRPAYTFEDPQYDKVNDEVYDNFGLDSDVKAKKKEAKCKEVELDGPEYGNFGSVSDKKIQSQAVEDEDPVYGNIVVPIPMKQIVVTADIETPEYGNFGENVPEVQNVKEEPKVTKYGDIQDDPIYGNF